MCVTCAAAFTTCRPDGSLLRFLAPDRPTRPRRDMPGPNTVPLVHCSNCQALYQVVKVQAGAETVDLEIACQVCNEPLTAREGQFVLKYFLLREATRRARRAPRPSIWK